MDLSFEELEKHFSDDEKNKKIEFDELIEKARYENTKNMDSWDMASLFYEITHHSLFNTRFSDVREFSSYAGYNKSTIYNNLRVLEFDKVNGLDHSRVSVTKAFELSRTGKDYGKFVDFMKDKDLEIEELSVHKIREYIDTFYGKEKKDCVEIIHEGQIYEIPANVLKKYIEEQDHEEINNLTINSFSWIVKNSSIAYKKIDKSVYLSNGTGIPEDIRSFWRIETLNPGDSVTAFMVFKDRKYEFIIKRDEKPEPYRTKMWWHKDFSSALSETLDYSLWCKGGDYYFSFEKTDSNNVYLLELIKKL